MHPALAIFQVGHRNRYKHPKPQVYARYGDMGIVRLRTDVEGAVVLEVGEEMAVTRYRVSRPRYWHEQ